jgi:hypothetical protein
MYELPHLSFNASVEEFLKIMWDDDVCFDKVLKDMGEVDILINNWESVVNNMIKNAKTRTITSKHPLPTLPWIIRATLPWLPESTNSSNIQNIYFDNSAGILRVSEASRVTGIPFVEPTVMIDWEVRQSSTGTCDCNLTLSFSYAKPTILETLLEMTTRTEIVKLVRQQETYINAAISAARENNTSLTKLDALSHLWNDDIIKITGQNPDNETTAVGNSTFEEEKSCVTSLNGFLTAFFQTK